MKLLSFHFCSCGINIFAKMRFERANRCRIWIAARQEPLIPRCQLLTSALAWRRGFQTTLRCSSRLTDAPPTVPSHTQLSDNLQTSIRRFDIVVGSSHGVCCGRRLGWAGRIAGWKRPGLRRCTGRAAHSVLGKSGSDKNYGKSGSDKNYRDVKHGCQRIAECRLFCLLSIQRGKHTALMLPKTQSCA